MVKYPGSATTLQGQKSQADRSQVTAKYDYVDGFEYQEVTDWNHQLESSHGLSPFMRLVLQYIALRYY